jgi:hypothetical protein
VLSEEPTFVPERHLALEKPTTVVTLADLGYDDTVIAASSTSLAITGPFRLLSEAGVAALREVSLALQNYKKSCERIPNMVRGAAYRSTFVRDFCLCPIVNEFLSELAGTHLAPHSLPSMLGHFNFAPEDVTKAVDKWHTDTIGMDYVLMLTNPAQFIGGKFQYFYGTKEEGATILQHQPELPLERIMTVDFPDAGYAVLQQGSLVLHRATQLQQKAERITMVNGYVSLDLRFPEQNRFRDMKSLDSSDILFPEWARYKAWVSRNKLDALIKELPFTGDRTVICAALREAIADVEAAIADIEDTSTSKMIYYGN